MKLLKPGTGNQNANRKAAIQYIVEHIIDTDTYDLKAGNITSKDGTSYHVSAYAESSAAFVSTPGVDKSKYSIYASGLLTLMFRQIKNDDRSFIYEVDPAKIYVKPNSTSAQWSDIEKASSRIWICTDEIVKPIDRRTRN
jgi:hypothetical protein